MTLSSRHKRLGFILGLVIISLAFLYLRSKTLGHLLVWDEARNIIALRSFLSNNAADPLYWNYFFHPPLYMVCAGLLSPFKAGLDIRLELLSLLFSCATLVIVYLLSAKIGGRLYAFLAGLFLSVMPVSIAHDTWIKRDGLGAAFGYLAVFLLVKKKFFWCAVALSFSMLAKENALFFILAVTVLLFVLKEGKIFKKIVVIYGVLFILTSWWYIYFSSMPKLIFDIYLSAEKNAAMWAQPPWYYLEKLLPDLGVPILLFFIAGTAYLLYMIFQARRYRWSVPIVVSLCVYIPSSFVIACKTPWLSLSAAPALAMTAAGGALFLLKRAKTSKFARVVLASLLILSIFTGFSFSYEKYHMDTYMLGWSEAKSSRDLALYLNEHVRSGETVMLTEFSYWIMPVCPVFLYYWKGGPLRIISGRDKYGDIMKEITGSRISWFAVVDSPSRQFDFRSLVKEITASPLGKPAIVEWSYVWRTDSLWRDSYAKKK